MKTSFRMLFSMLFVILSGFVWSQKTVTGTVLDQDGFPVSDATVTVKDSGESTLTDFDGNYSIMANEGDQIEVDALGFAVMSQPVGASNTLNFSVSEGGSLDEVVVTALGISREKKSLGYATQEISGEEVSEIPVANFADALSGQIAGLDTKNSGTIGGSSNIIIRGSGSITGNNQALIVIDGTPVNNNTYNSSDQRTGRGGYDYGNAAMDINPNDIESYNVLKGAAATALYGSRAANGAIIITTKKGKKRKGIGVAVSSSYSGGVVNKETLPRYQDKYGAGYGPRLFDDFYYADMNGDGEDDRVVQFDWDGSFGAAFDPNLSVYQWDSFYPILGDTYLKPRPWVAGKHTPNDVWLATSTFENSISFSGGNEEGSFRLGFTNLNTGGGLPNTSIKKNVINFSGSYNLTEKLRASADISYNYNSGKGRWGTGYDSNNPNQTFRQWWQTNVDVYEQRDAYRQTGQNISWDPSAITPVFGYQDFTPIYHDNFYWMRDNNYQTDSRNRYLGNVSVNYEIVKNLNLLGRYAFDTYDEKREERWAVGSTSPDGSAKGKGQYSLNNRNVGERNYDLILSWNKDLTDKINLDFNAGWNLRVNDYFSSVGVTNGGLKIPDLYTLSNSINALTSSDVNQTDWKMKVDGEYARASFGFDKTYYLEGSFRTDRSSALPSENNRYNYFSVSGSAVLSNLISANWLDFWKVRANYAEVGNAPTTPYQVFNTFNIVPSFGAIPSGSNPTTSNNPDLKAETQKGWEVGTELAFWNNRASLDFSYYDNLTEDLLTTTLVSEASGVYQGFVNAGDVRNKGIEISLNVTPLKKSDFSWEVGFNWAKNKNEVERLAGDAEFYSLADVQGGINIGAYVGNPLGVIVGTDYYYDSNGNKVVGSNGFYEGRNNQIIGNINPDWTGGIKNTFNYKNLRFSFLIDMQHGGNVFSLDTWYGYGTGLYDWTAGNNDLGNPLRDPLTDGPDSGGVILNGVTGTINENADGSYTVTDTAENTKRVATDTYANPWGWARGLNREHVYDASFVKLRYVSLSYTIPNDFFGGSFINGLTLSAYGRNLWIIDKKVPYADPEAGLSAGNIQGYQSGAYPSFKEFGASVKFEF